MATSGPNASVVGTTEYVYDGGQLLVTQNASTAKVVSRVLAGPLGTPIAEDRPATPDAASVLASEHWLLSDYRGSVTAVADSTGAVSGQASYDSFGKITSGSVNPAMAGTYFGYTGQQFDVQTGLDFFNARYYDPSLGRFLSQDPIGFGGRDANLYRYAGNNPVNATDPSGLDEEK